MTIADDLSLILTDVNAMGVARVITATVFQRSGSAGSDARGRPSARNQQVGDEFECLLLPVSDSRTVQFGRDLRQVTDTAFCETDQTVSPHYILHSSDGSEYTVLQVQSYGDHHMELSLQKAS